MKRAEIFFAGIIFLAAGFCTPALAHEHRAAAGGELVVGFLNEPAFSGNMNGVDLRVKKDGEPVTGLEDLLHVTVTYGDEAAPLELGFRRRYNKPGEYAAYFLPSRPGRYRFQIRGELEGKVFDETFISGPGTFGDVEDVEALKFPAN